MNSGNVRIEDFAADVPLVFMHVPKTAGTALTQALCASLSPRNFISGFDRVFFGDFRRFDTIDPELQRSIYLEPGSLPANADFVSGHISYSTLRQSYPHAQYFTVLREPVSRLLSFWLYWRSQTQAQLRVWGDWARCVERNRGPLSEFLLSREIAGPTDNLHLRMLLWPHPLIPDNDFIDERNDKVLVELALVRLGEFAFRDIVENPELQTRMQRWLGRPISLGRANETVSASGIVSADFQEELSPEVRRALELRTRLDLKLWTAVAGEVGIANPESLRDSTLKENIARYARHPA